MYLDVSAHRGNSSAEKILKSAVFLVARDGVDAISVASLVQEAGVSRPTFYAHFGDIDGLLAEIWLESYKSWVLDMCDPSELNVVGDPRSSALVQILLVAHRKSQVEESVRSLLPTLIDDSFPLLADKTVALWTFANRVGIIASIDVWPLAERAKLLDGYLAAVTGKVSNSDLLETEELAEIGPTSEPDDHEKIVLATMQIVQKSGVAALSIARLGRMLRVTSGFIYPRIVSQDVLVAEAFSYALKQATSLNLVRWRQKKRGLEGFAEFLVGGLGDPRADWRRFRGEVLLAANHAPELANSVAQSLDDFARDVTKQAALLPVPKELVQTLAVFVHTLLFGFSLIQHAGINGRDLFHIGVIRAMLAEIGRRIVTGSKIS